MRRLQLLVLALALLAPVSAPFGIPWGALARGGAAAAKVERAAAAAVSMERAGATAAKAGLGAERATMALSAEQRAATLASEGKLGLQRAQDGRFLLSAGAASARLVHRRVFSSILESPPAVLMRAADGRFTRIAGLAAQGPALVPGLVLVADKRPAAGPDNPMIGFATQAMADAVATAFRAAVVEVHDREDNARAQGVQTRAPPKNRAALMTALTKDVIRAMQDDTVLFKAQNISVAKETGYQVATLWSVKAVYLFEEKNEPAALWIEMIDMPKQTKNGYIARVNLDEVLALIPKDGL